jgi:serine/threonine protein phosphatase PrpC
VTGYVKLNFHTTACCNTDPGLVRLQNEDTCLVNTDNGYFLVADGMGNPEAGKMAGVLFKDVVVERFCFQPNHTPEITPNLLQDCFQIANSKIQFHVMEQPGHSGMGCTAELLAFHGSGFILGHVGDSRTYRLRNGKLKQLTKDHTFLEEQIKLGLIPPGQYRNHPMSHTILRAVGSSEKLDVDIIQGDYFADDIFMLCTDGLTDMVDDIKIQEILQLEWPLAIKATMLIDQANYSGGKDNIAVALIEVKTAINRKLF